MLKRFIASFSLAILLMALVCGVALAAWEYKFPIYVTDNSGVARNYYPVVIPELDIQGFIDSDLVDSDAMDTNMQIGNDSMKYMLATDNVAVVVDSLPASGTKQVDFYTGYSPKQTVLPIVTGSGGNVTANDSADWEPGYNSETAVYGYFNTVNGSGKNVFRKGSYSCYVSNEAELTASTGSVSNSPDRDDSSYNWTATENAYDGSTSTSANVVIAEGNSSNFTLMTFATGSYNSSAVRVFSSNTTGNDTIDVDIQYGGVGTISAIQDISVETGGIGGGHEMCHISSNVFALAYGGDGASDNASWVKTYSANNTGQISAIDTYEFHAAANPARDARIFQTSANICALTYRYEGGANDPVNLETVDIGNNGTIGSTKDTVTVSADGYAADLLHIWGDVYMLAIGESGAVTLETRTINGTGDISNSAVDTFTLYGSLGWDIYALVVAESDGTSDAVVAVVFYTTFGGVHSEIKTIDVSASGTFGASVIETFNTGLTNEPHSFIRVFGDIYALASDGAGGVRTIQILPDGDIGASWIDSNPAGYPGGGTTQYLQLKHLYGNYFWLAYQENSTQDIWAVVLPIQPDGDVQNYVDSAEILTGFYYNVASVSIVDDVYAVFVRDGDSLNARLGTISIDKGSWADLYEGNHAGGWASYTVSPVQLITDIRVKYTNASDGGGNLTYNLYEVEVTHQATVTASVASGLHTVNVTFSEAVLGLNVDGVLEDSEYFYYPIEDNASDWAIGENDVVSYMDFFRHTVGGTLVGHYEPTQLLFGSILPDRAGTAQNGTVNWGSNANIVVSFGEVEGDEPVEPEEPSPPTIAPSVLPATWFGCEDADLLGLPFYDVYSDISTQTGQPVEMLYFISILGFAIGAFMIMAVAVKSALLGVICMNLVLVVGASMCIVPSWIPFTVVIVQVGIMYLYKQVAY